MTGTCFRCFAGSSESSTSSNGTCLGIIPNQRVGESAAEQYWKRNVLGIHNANTEEGIEVFNRYLVLCLNTPLEYCNHQLLTDNKPNYLSV